MTIAADMLHQFTTFGDLFKYLRKRARLTQQALGIEVGYSTTTINRYEHNQQLPDPQAITALFAKPLGLHNDAAALSRLLDLLQQELQSQIHEVLAPKLTDPDAALGSASSALAFNDLPIPPTEIIGRTHDIAHVMMHLQKHKGRLLTLVGPPGVGKSRLALEVATQFAAQARVAKFISCAHLIDPVQVIPVLLSALNVALPNVDGRSAFETLMRHLRDQSLLIVLDNLEQLLGQDLVPRQIADLLAACSCLHFVVTSREPLQIRAEQVIAVQALSEQDAIQLFESRAKAADDAFGLTKQNSYIVRRICQRLDFLPLAIELIASRVTVNTPQQIFDLLARSNVALQYQGAADLPERHRTLHNAIAWSYQLLDSVHQQAFRTLGCFSGNFSADAAASLGCNADHLSLLVRRNLVKRVALQPVPYFVLLNSLTEFAKARLHDFGEWNGGMMRHLAYYLALAETTRPHLTGSDRLSHMARLNAEHYNLMMAMDWALGQADIDSCYRFVYALGHFWEYQIYNRQVLPWLSQLYELGCQIFEDGDIDKTRRGAEICRGASVVAWQADDLHLSVKFGLRSLQLARRSADAVMLIYALETAAFLMSQAGYQIENAQALFEESWQLREVWRETMTLMPPRINPTMLCVNIADFRRLCARYEHDLGAWRRFGNLNYLGLVLYVLGDTWACLKNDLKAEPYYRESLLVSNRSQHKQRVSWANYGLGCVLQRQGRGNEAISHLQQAYVLFEEAGNELAMLDCLLALNIFVIDMTNNAKLLGAYATRLQAKRARAFPIEQLHYEFLLAYVQATLPKVDFDILFEAGRSLSLEEVLGLVSPPHQPSV